MAGGRAAACWPAHRDQQRRQKQKPQRKLAEAGELLGEHAAAAGLVGKGDKGYLGLGWKGAAEGLAAASLRRGAALPAAVVAAAAPRWARAGRSTAARGSRGSGGRHVSGARFRRQLAA